MPWLEELRLNKDDEENLISGKWLNDTLIDAGQRLLQKQFGEKFKRLQDLCLTRTLSLDICQGEFVKILNKNNNHWFTISTIGCKYPATVRVYDSATKYVTYRNKEEISSLLTTLNSKITLH